MNRWIEALAVSPDGRVLAVVYGPGVAEVKGGGYTSASGPLTVQIWNMTTGKPIAEFVGGEGNQVRLAFAPDSACVAVTTFNYDTSLLVRNVRTNENVLASTRHEEVPTLACCFEEGRGGNYSLSCLGRTWDFVAGRPTLRGEFPRVPGAFTADHQYHFFGESSKFDERFYPLPVLVRGPGILETFGADLRPVAFLKYPLNPFDAFYFSDSKVFGEITEFLPGRSSESSGSLLWGQMLVDLNSYTCHLLLKEKFVGGATYGFAISDDKRMIAACGAWGVAVWQLP